MSSADTPMTRRTNLRRIAGGWLFLAPAVLIYGGFVLAPAVRSIEYSFYDWNGIGDRRFIGFANYRAIIANEEIRSSIVNAFILVFFFAVIPVSFALSLVSFVRRERGLFGATSRTILIIPQVMPLVAAGLAWKWMYSSNGLVNQTLSAVGLDRLSRPWLSDFDLALPAVGVIGTWTLFGFCLVLLLAGAGRIDPSLYEAVRLDGAGPVAEFFAVTLPGLRREIGVAITVTVIAALKAFDVVFITTQGGPGRVTMVPGVLIYRLAFTTNQVGLASAVGVVLAMLVLVIVLPVQRLFRSDR